MKLIIDIDDKRIKVIKILAKEQNIATPYPTLEQIIANGIPLDKIRAEIEALPKTYPFINHIDTYVKEDDVKKIIDKYKAEGSE